MWCTRLYGALAYNARYVYKRTIGTWIQPCCTHLAKHVKRLERCVGLAIEIIKFVISPAASTRFCLMLLYHWRRSRSPNKWALCSFSETVLLKRARALCLLRLCSSNSLIRRSDNLSMWRVRRSSWGLIPRAASSSLAFFRCPIIARVGRGFGRVRSSAWPWM